MTISYYWRNELIALCILSFVVADWFIHPADEDIILILRIIASISCPLFPFAKRIIELIALRFTTQRFWHTGFFSDDIGKSGLYALYWLACFFFAIPLSGIYLFMNKKLNPISQ